MSKKSFLHNIWNIIIGGNETPNQRHISVSQADNLQKKYLESRKTAAIIADYPPYVDIARQMFSEKSEIFKAAVFYLCRIAENESKYAEAIVSVMKEYQKTAQRSEEDMEYLAKKIVQAEKNLHFSS